MPDKFGGVKPPASRAGADCSIIALNLNNKKIFVLKAKKLDAGRFSMTHSR
jgi:hypothetical protein